MSKCHSIKLLLVWLSITVNNCINHVLLYWQPYIIIKMTKNVNVQWSKYNFIVDFNEFSWCNKQGNFFGMLSLTFYFTVTICFDWMKKVWMHVIFLQSMTKEDQHDFSIYFDGELWSCAQRSKIQIIKLMMMQSIRFYGYP